MKVSFRKVYLFSASWLVIVGWGGHTAFACDRIEPSFNKTTPFSHKITSYDQETTSRAISSSSSLSIGSRSSSSLLSQTKQKDERVKASLFLMIKGLGDQYRDFYPQHTVASKVISLSLSQLPSDLLGYIGEDLAFDDITCLRQACKSTYSHPFFAKWGFIRLYRQPVSNRFTYLHYQAIMGVSRTLVERFNSYQLPEKELSFIEERLSKDPRFSIVMAYIPALRGDEKATFKAMKVLAQKGNQHAQKLVNQALYEGELGQGRRPGGKRFKQLQATADASTGEGNQHAQKLVNQALYGGELGQGRRSETQRFTQLLKIAAKGDLDAQCYILKRFSGRKKLRLLFGVLGENLKGLKPVLSHLFVIGPKDKNIED